jgi:hypothetical protein
MWTVSRARAQAERPTGGMGQDVRYRVGTSNRDSRRLTVMTMNPKIRVSEVTGRAVWIQPETQADRARQLIGTELRHTFRNK